MPDRGPRAYRYRGPEALRRAAERQLTGTTIRSLADLHTWLEGHPEAVTEAATFVVMTDGTLRLAARQVLELSEATQRVLLHPGRSKLRRRVAHYLAGE